MRKILLGVLILGMVSCTNDKMKSDIDQYTFISQQSSLNFQIKIKLYFLSHPDRKLDYKTLDSIREVSDKEINEFIIETVKDVYK